MRLRIRDIARQCAVFIGLLLVAVSLILLGADLISTLQSGGEPVLRSLADIWSSLDATGPVHAQKWADQHLPAVRTLLDMILPLHGWLLCGPAGVLLIFFFAPGRKP